MGRKPQDPTPSELLTISRSETLSSRLARPPSSRVGDLRPVEPFPVLVPVAHRSLGWNEPLPTPSHDIWSVSAAPPHYPIEDPISRQMRKV
jgi:hypothetical protein